LESRIFKKTCVGGENAPAFQKNEVMREMTGCFDDACKATGAICPFLLACFGGRVSKNKLVGGELAHPRPHNHAQLPGFSGSLVALQLLQV
jgi:hypothetical protein